MAWYPFYFLSLLLFFFRERDLFPLAQSGRQQAPPPPPSPPPQLKQGLSHQPVVPLDACQIGLLSVTFFSKQWRKLFCASWTKCSATCAKKSKPSTCSKCISRKRLTRATASPPIGGSLCPVSCHQAGVFPCRPSSAHPSGADRFHLTVTDVVLVSPLSPAVAPASNRRRSAANRRARANSLAIRST